MTCKLGDFSQLTSLSAVHGWSSQLIGGTGLFLSSKAVPCPIRNPAWQIDLSPLNHLGAVTWTNHRYSTDLWLNFRQNPTCQPKVRLLTRECQCICFQHVANLKIIRGVWYGRLWQVAEVVRDSMSRTRTHHSFSAMELFFLAQSDRCHSPEVTWWLRLHAPYICPARPSGSFDVAIFSKFKRRLPWPNQIYWISEILDLHNDSKI